jgi:hypothetical protein
LSQHSYLKIESLLDADNAVIDSLGYEKKHATGLLLVEEIKKFSNKLSLNGYLESTNEPPLKINDSTYLVKYILGAKNRLINIDVGENAKILNLDKDTIILPISETESFLKGKLQELEKKGYSLAKLQLINFKKSNNRLYAALKLSIDKVRFLDDIVVNGYEKFPVSHSKNIKRLYRKRVFNQENLKSIYNDFEKFRFIRQSKYPEILFTNDSTKVYVYLEKTKPNTFDGFIGFSNDDKNKVTINGYLDLQLQNILNAGERFSIFWKSDGKDQKTFNGAVELPYLFKSRLGFKAQLNIFKQDSIFQNTQTAIDLGYYFNYNTKAFLGYQSAESSDIQNTNNAIISDYKNAFITSHLDYTIFNPDDFLFPDKTQLFFKVGTGMRSSKLNNNSQFFLNLNVNHNFYLNKKNIINVRSQNYYLKSGSYIINELHRFGGINSIRGFNENSLQGNVVSTVLTEYRYAFNQGVYAHTIIDYGYYEDKTANSSTSIYGLGFGVGLLTKNGIFNLVYANGNVKSENVKLSNAIVHVSFKARF